VQSNGRIFPQVVLKFERKENTLSKRTLKRWMHQRNESLAQVLSSPSEQDEHNYCTPQNGAASSSPTANKNEWVSETKTLRIFFFLPFKERDNIDKRALTCARGDFSAGHKHFALGVPDG